MPNCSGSQTAFPRAAGSGTIEGLTKREYIAAHVAGSLAATGAYEESVKLANDAVGIADALIQALAQ